MAARFGGRSTEEEHMDNSLTNQTSLKRRVLGAGLWSIAGYAVNRFVRMFSSLIMTRLLVPEVFGVMAIAFLIITGLSLLSDVGLGQNIVQSERGNYSRFLNTAWVVQIIRGFLLWVSSLGIALLIIAANRFNLVPKDTVYADSSLPYVIVVLSLIAVITGLRSTKVYEANRYLSFGRPTQIAAVAQVAGLLCTLAWIFIDRSIWALVSGALVSALVSTILSYAWLPGTANRWQWDSEAFKEIFHFGKWIFVSSLFGFLASSGDRLLLGYMVDTTTLGIYAIAFLLFSSVEQVMNIIIQSVGFPAISEVARRGTGIKSAYYRFHAVIAPTAYFSMGFLVMAGQELVDILYDHRYTQAGWMLEVLAIGFLAVPSRIVGQCYLALGASGLTAALAGIRVVLLCTLLPLGFYFLGLPGALIGIMLSYLSNLPSVILFSRKYDLLDFRKELLLLPIMLLGLIVGKLFTITIGWFVR
jgi:O-antigen/teichoic acid export membrane protein